MNIKRTAIEAVLPFAASAALGCAPAKAESCETSPTLPAQYAQLLSEIEGLPLDPAETGCNVATYLEKTGGNEEADVTVTTIGKVAVHGRRLRLPPANSLSVYVWGNAKKNPQGNGNPIVDIGLSAESRGVISATAIFTPPGEPASAYQVSATGKNVIVSNTWLGTSSYLESQPVSDSVVKLLSFDAQREVRAIRDRRPVPKEILGGLVNLYDRVNAVAVSGP